MTAADSAGPPLSGPTPFLNSPAAPQPRTLVDILTETVQRYGDQPALDNGTSVLTYEEFADQAMTVAEALAGHGIGRGERVGVRIASGTTDLYVAILGILLAGCAYVPVDADDPDERARVVFGEAGVAAVIGNDLVIAPRGAAGGSSGAASVQSPRLEDDAWIIFTSGSTGTPKGVAVSHRSAAAFVDAEARLFLTAPGTTPLGPSDRVMAGLSVAFDASCEEMWLAWRHGACLVPAPRSLVRSGMDLGPWLVANGITVVSTVPTLVSLWPVDALDAVRLLILGGEAAPREIGARLAGPNREVWNTYGPTEATVVACAAPLDGSDPVRIGLPLDGWDLAVVDRTSGVPVAPGEVGELIIGGVGLARYLDAERDAAAYAPLPSLGWPRAYRSGDLVRADPEGLVFMGRADDQVKVGGRRIELGEVDSALLQLPGVVGAAAAVRPTDSGTPLLVGYLTVSPEFDAATAKALLKERMPAALVPRLAIVDDLPTRTSGKIDRDALPWPMPAAGSSTSAAGGRTGAPLTLTDSQRWLAEQWNVAIGATPESLEDDFFDLGGGSLTAAKLMSSLRTRHPEVTVADVYEHPTLGSLSAYLDELEAPTSRLNRDVLPVPLKSQLGQFVAVSVLRTIAGLRWTGYVAAGCTIAAHLAPDTLGTVLPTASWWWIAALWLFLGNPAGRMALAAIGARLILLGIRPGSYPRGGKVHLRVWLAQRLADALGAPKLSGAVLLVWYARMLGARVGRHVDLHAAPPVTGMLTVGDHSSVEPEVDLTGAWLDDGRLEVGHITLGTGTRIGARSTLAPGSHVGDGAVVAPGAAVLGHIPAGEYWSGAPAMGLGAVWNPPSARPRGHGAWRVAYATTAWLIALLPGLAVLAGLATAWPLLSGARSIAELAIRTPGAVALAAVVAFVALALLVLILVRLLALGLRAGRPPVLSRPGWQAWATVRVLDEARTWLFPLYSSMATPAWLRALGARIGAEVEASTVLLIPSLTTVGSGAFLADDTLIGGYELGDGRMRIESVKVGKRAFVGNSGMAAPGRRVPKNSLVAVLSAAPARTEAKKGTSWIGSPPAQLRRDVGGGDDTRTFAPATRLKVLRALVESCRLLAVLTSAALATATAAALILLAGAYGWVVAAALSGVVLIVAGALAALVTSAVKWLLVGRFRRSEHPLWSSFVWRSELADTFVEVVCAPWFAVHVTGTPILNAWLRSMGATVGHGVWCDTYWLPEADLVTLHDGATVGAGCVVQTHLFHDRVLSMDEVVLRAGATLGPNSVVLPGAVIGRHATIGPASLVMRGESVPDKTRWIGNPIAPWA